MKFKKYVELTTESSDVIGEDFLEDSKRVDFPDIETWRELEHFLWSRDACEGAIEGAKLVWKEFENSKIKTP